MALSKDKAALAILWVAAPLFVALAIVGAVRHYTIVPHWDAWHGYLHFFTRVNEGHWREWWAQHNEHRIVLARLLFWVDLAWFRGTAWFLIAVNYLLVLGAFLTFRAIVARLALPARQTTAANLFILACLFSWLQWENLTWAFQSQFFLAQWLPLMALYLLYRASLPVPEAGRCFALAAVVGVLCIGTMASGVLALPILTAYAAILRMDWRRTTLLALLAVGCIALYFHGYSSTPGHGSVGATLRQNPVELVQYVLVYLGTPFYRMFGGKSLALAQAFGAVFVALTVAKAVQCLRAPGRHALALGLLAYILFIGGTATGTGAGRVLFGIGQATASRYTTPTLMAWMALLVLYLPWIGANLGRARVIVPMAAVLGGLLVPQLLAARSERNMLFERDVAALSLEMRAFDGEQVHNVFFNTGWALALTRVPVEQNLSVFGKPVIRDAGLMIGRPAGPLPPAVCRGAFTEVANLPRDARFQRVSGWIATAAGPNPIEAIGLVDAQGLVVGYALVGRPAPGVQVPQGQARRFKGYLLRSAFEQPLSLVAKGGECSAAVQAPTRPALRLEAVDQPDPATGAPASAVVASQGWTGTDAHRSRLKGLAVSGSWVTADSDMGSVTLQLRRGDRVYYRSGPISGHQRFQVDDGQTFRGLLPVADDWMALVLDNPRLPDQFTLTLTDGGAGWGEWSAIALKE